MPLPLPHPAANALNGLLQRSALIWRGRETSRPKTRSTGFPVLDGRLPGGGWPVGALIEIAPSCEGLGELSLALPLLRDLCREGRPVALVSPPHIPYAPALVRADLPLNSIVWIDASHDADARWSAEQILRGGHAGAVLVWSPTEDERALRRVQLAAETGIAFAFMFRPASTLCRSSPAALRVALYPAEGGTHAELVKVRGGRTSRVTLPLSPAFT
jgi:protein ImuA